MALRSAEGQRLIATKLNVRGDDLPGKDRVRFSPKREPVQTGTRDGRLSAR